MGWHVKRCLWVQRKDSMGLIQRHSQSLTLSERSSTGVLPSASASACAKKLDISSSWLDTTSPCNCGVQDREHGAGEC